MNKKLVIILTLAGVLVLSLGIVLSASAVSGAAFTTYNPWVDGDFKDVCKNSQVNCNIYGAKPDVWLNGGPAANGLGPDGEYFFAVLVPGGQPDPNDGGAKNLSDDFDLYTNRTFSVIDGEVGFYGGTHDQDSGDTLDASRPFCDSPRGCTPDGNPPFIRLDPYADTWNPGGVYILAICSLADGYPVEPRDCKYDAFKVKEGRVTYDLMLKGFIFKDRPPFGPFGPEDFPLTLHWAEYLMDIHVFGTGFAGETIDAVITPDSNSYWEYGVSYTFNKTDPVQAAELTICEIDPIWPQTYPADGACWEIVIEPAAMAFVDGLDFGNYPYYPK
jgi:hypothetical protein